MRKIGDEDCPPLEGRSKSLISRRGQWLKLDVLWFFVGASALALVFAYFSQYFLNLKPCILCLYQRIPFFLVVFLGFLGVFWVRGRGILAVAAGLLIFVNFCLAVFHVGVENGVFELTGKCVEGVGEFGSVEELAGFLKEQSLGRCDRPEFLFLGVSFAGWNAVFCLGLLVLGGRGKPN